MRKLLPVLAMVALASGVSRSSDAQLPPIAGIDGHICAFASIQSAINAASTNGTIYVALNGNTIRTEQLTINGKTLTIQPASTTCTGFATIGNLVVDGGAQSRASAGVLDVVNGNVTIRRMTLRNGVSQGSGGILRVTGTAALPASVTLTEGASLLHGTATRGGGAAVGASASLTLAAGATVLDNVARGPGGHGGAIAVFDGGKLVVEGASIGNDKYPNRAETTDGTEARGHGISVEGDATTAELRAGATVSFNGPLAATTTTSRGGGIYVAGGVVTLAGASSVVSNRATVSPAVHIDRGKLLTRGTIASPVVVANNDAERASASIRLTGGAAALERTILRANRSGGAPDSVGVQVVAAGVDPKKACSGTAQYGANEIVYETWQCMVPKLAPIIQSPVSPTPIPLP